LWVPFIPDGGLAVDAKGRLFVGCGSDGNVKMLVEDPSLHLQGSVFGGTAAWLLRTDAPARVCSCMTVKGG
jgi:hypothetical protein